MEPTGHGIGLAQRAGLAGQDQERGLEGVLGVVSVMEDLAADAQHHRPVPLH